MSSNSSTSTTPGHTYRSRPITKTSLSKDSNPFGTSSNTSMSHSSSTPYYGSSAASAVASPTWSYSSPSQLARRYANITPIWCHITKPRQLKKKFASTFHQAQSLVGFYNEDRAPSERRTSINQPQQTQTQTQTQLQQQQQQQQSQLSSHQHVNVNNSSNHHYDLSNNYRQPYSSHYTPHDSIVDSSLSSVLSSSRPKKKYTGGAMTTHLSTRLPSPPAPPLSSPSALEEKFANPGERKARIDQLKDLVFNTRVKETMVGRTDSRTRSTTNLHKANSFKRIDQITNPLDDHSTSMIPPLTPTRKDSHYYHYHIPSSSLSSTINENLNRPILPSAPSTPTAAAPSSSSSHSTYNYDYLRAKSKEHPRQTYHESSYLSNPMESTSSSHTATNASTLTGSTSGVTPLTSYRTSDEHSYLSKPSSLTSKPNSYSAITSYPSYQTPGASKRRIKKYLLAKGTSSTGLSHQTEPIVANMAEMSLHDADDDKPVDDEESTISVSKTRARTPPSLMPALTRTRITLDSSPPTTSAPTTSPPRSSPPPTSSSQTANESAVFSTPNAQLSPSPVSSHNDNNNNRVVPTILVPLSASLTSLNRQQQQLLTKPPSNAFVELVPTHAEKEQSPSRSMVPPSTADDGCGVLCHVCLKRTTLPCSNSCAWSDCVSRSILCMTLQFIIWTFQGDFID